MKVRYKINGRKVTPEEFSRTKLDVEPGVPMVNDAYKRPLESIGMACTPGQVAEFNRLYADAGIVGAQHKPDGTLVMDSRSARNSVLRFRNLRDNDAGYGDHAGRH